MPRGGAVRARAAPTPSYFGRAKRRLILFVHGFNTTRDGARESYQKFVEHVERLGAPARTILEDCVWFFWPGDANLGRFSFLSYPTEIGPAIQSAARLREWLDTVSGPEGTPTEIVLIGHSLGNRVLLELLREVSGTPLPRAQISRVCLMAAAVPVPHVRQGQLLHAGARLARTRALFSRGDGVLSWAFPLGQTAAGDGFMPEAVGHAGNPSGVWGSSQAMWISKVEAYDHNDYWVSEPTAWEVASFLGAPVGVPPPLNAISSRGLRAANAIGTPAMPHHELPASRLFG